MELSNQSNSQVLLTSHAPYFLNNIENYSQIKRISIKDGISNLREVSHNEVLQICEKNGDSVEYHYKEGEYKSWIIEGKEFFYDLQTKECQER